MSRGRAGVVARPRMNTPPSNELKNASISHLEIIGRCCKENRPNNRPTTQRTSPSEALQYHFAARAPPGAVPPAGGPREASKAPPFTNTPRRAQATDGLPLALAAPAPPRVEAERARGPQRGRGAHADEEGRAPGAGAGRRCDGVAGQATAADVAAADAALARMEAELAAQIRAPPPPPRRARPTATARQATRTARRRGAASWRKSVGRRGSTGRRACRARSPAQRRALRRLSAILADGRAARRARRAVRRGARAGGRARGARPHGRAAPPRLKSWPR